MQHDPPAAKDPVHIGLLIFPQMTQLDMTGPYEVFHRMPGAAVHLIAETLDLQVSEHGLPIQPTVTFETCPPLDVIVIPGGFGINDLLLHEPTLAFVRQAAQDARYVGSVCTGALLLGAAGLLLGRRATTHWMSLDLLAELGANPVRERVVKDDRFFTGGGITAGIDFALAMVGEIRGLEAAEEIQLAMEYDPEPPLDCGSPEKASPAVVEGLRKKWSAGLETRREKVQQVRRRLAIENTPQ